MLNIPVTLGDRTREVILGVAVRLNRQLLLAKSNRRGSMLLEYALMAGGVGLVGTCAAGLVGGEAAHALLDVQNSLCTHFKSMCIR